MKLDSISVNPNNPRTITEKSFQKLVQSILEFPRMLSLRPIVYDKKRQALGGNQRYQALKAIMEMPENELLDRLYSKKQSIQFWTSIRKKGDLPDEWFASASDLTKDEQNRFIIADNIPFGNWDWEVLSNEWEVEVLDDWGLHIPGFDIDVPNYADKNRDVDIDDLDALMTISLKYSEDEYWVVKEKLSKIAQTPEQAVWKLIQDATV